MHAARAGVTDWLRGGWRAQRKQLLALTALAGLCVVVKQCALASIPAPKPSLSRARGAGCCRHKKTKSLVNRDV